ncbi:zinc ABC transporter substrate-binding protein [Ruegeria atlantica]|uniref:High-affinity zinc uptake system protein ZnuA n=1 Tax=Ruegeria atlantica TaxID=81569 RepID=A0A0P1EXQ6_9RHOB|nr:zinc ABC transporter substrate-binding protein [Ruegeria atlantica]CUH46936.1 High-affinity zinc uptake system protein ZnuA precursor [Ruegeria atlantica]
MSRKLLPVSITAALMGGTAMADVPNVAVDIAPVHSLVARVMEGVGAPNLIVQAGASPHEYNLRPSEAAALQNADLVFWIGEDLTPWMEGAVENLANGATVTPLLEADGTVLLDFREGALFEAHDHGDDELAEGDDHDDHGHEDHAEDKAHDDHDHGDEHAEGEDHDDHDHEDHADENDHDDHDHGDEHAEGDDHDDHGDEHAGHDDHHDHAHGDHDPHAWLSPENANTWLNVIAAQLSAADPDNAGAYFANAAAAREEMAALSAEINQALEPVRGGNFIVFHDAYQYFENAFDFPASGAISIGDASDPSPARIAEVQGRIREEGINCVLSEPQFNPGIVATVLDGTEANTGVIDPLGSDLEPGAKLYPQMIRNIAKTLAECL